VSDFVHAFVHAAFVQAAVQLLAQRAINERNVIVSNHILINEQTNPEGVKRF